MTKLTREKILKRETLCLDRRKPIVVELFPFYCGIRIKGTRAFYAVPWEALLDLGRKLEARDRKKAI